MQYPARAVFRCAMNATSTQVYPQLLRAFGGAGGTHQFHATATRMGIMNNMKKAYDRAVQGSEEQREKKVFDVQMKYMRGERRMDGDIFLEFLNDVKSASGLGGFKEHLPWVSNNPAIGELKEQEQILRAFSTEERKNVYGIRLGGLKRVAREVGVERVAVEAMVAQIKSWMALQKWLRGRIERGERLPRGVKEMRSMVAVQGAMNKSGRGGARMNPGIKGGTSAKRKLY